MIGKFIDFMLREKFLIIGFSILLLVGGLYAFNVLNIEAYPDPSPPTIEIIAQNAGWSAEEMERQITVPLETQLNGMPGLDHIRSISLFGLTDIKCYFRYETDYNFDRQEVLNRLQMAELPAGVEPQLSPTSAVGEIYRYQLVGDGQSLMDLKVAQDWILERQFKQVPGVIDVVSFGGDSKEFHIDLDPNKLIAFNISVPQVMNAVAQSNSNVGANYLEIGAQSYNVRGIGLFKDTEDIANVAVAAKNGTPIYVKQLGEVTIGAKVPLGKVGKDEQSDIVQGVVLMRRGEKSLPTLERVRQKVQALNNGILPQGMRIVPYYDRTNLINITTHTVTHTLIEGMVLVAFILLAFLGDLRASLVVALSIPLSLLFTFIVLVLRGDSANLISMGAIDFGIIVDASVVMVENIYRHLAELGPSRQHAGQLKILAVQLAAQEVSKPIFFSSAIIVAASLPLFTMTGVEGKVFGPMALTYGFALTGALLLALTFSPVMASIVLKPQSEEHETFVVRGIRRVYSRFLAGALSRPWTTVMIAVIALTITLSTLPFIGGEFMPKLEEGNLWVRAMMPNTVSFSYARQLADQMRLTFKKYPEVTDVVSQLGRPEDGTDPTSYFNCEFFVNLKPREYWRAGVDKPELVRQIEAEMRPISGVNYNFSQTIQENGGEAMPGVKGQKSNKLYRNNVDTISNIPVSMPDGGRIPLKQVAEIVKQTGASFIYREDNGRYIPIKFSVRGRDLQSTIAEAEEKIAEQIKLPAGYHYEWAGEVQELQAAVARLEIVVPISLLIIFFLLYSMFRSLRDALLLLGTVPLALIGGMISLLATHTNFSISAAVGFISLFGVSVLGGVILVSRIQQLREGGYSLRDAVAKGSELQLRPVLMAALAAAIGLLPASVATGIGSETQKPLARVVVGGMVTSAILILLVLPAMYLIVHRWAERRATVREPMEAEPASE